MVLNKRPIANYMETVQTQINPIARANCVDLMIFAAELLGCSTKMLHVAVYNLDRFFSRVNVDMKNLPIARITCLKLADWLDSVYEYLCHGQISAYEFMRTEARIQKHLQHDLAVTTAYSFLNRYVRTAHRARRAAPLAGLDFVVAFLADVSLLSTPMIRFSPSMVAASFIFLAQYVLDPHGEKPWNAILRDYTMFQASDLQECVLVLHEFLGGEQRWMPGIIERYSQTEMRFVACRIIPPAIPPHAFDDV